MPPMSLFVISSVDICVALIKNSDCLETNLHCLRGTYFYLLACHRPLLHILVFAGPNARIRCVHIIPMDFRNCNKKSEKNPQLPDTQKTPFFSFPPFVSTQQKPRDRWDTHCSPGKSLDCSLPHHSSHKSPFDLPRKVRMKWCRRCRD